MTPKTKKYLLWGGGGAIVLFLGYKWWKGRKERGQVGIQSQPLYADEQPTAMQDFGPPPPPIVKGVGGRGGRVVADPAAAVPATVVGRSTVTGFKAAPSKQSLASAIKAAIGGNPEQMVVNIPAGTPSGGVIPEHVKRQMDQWQVMNANRQKAGLAPIPMPTADAFASGNISVMKVGR